MERLQEDSKDVVDAMDKCVAGDVIPDAYLLCGKHLFRLARLFGFLRMVATEALKYSLEHSTRWRVLDGVRSQWRSFGALIQSTFYSGCRNVLPKLLEALNGKLSSFKS